MGANNNPAPRNSVLPINVRVVFLIFCCYCLLLLQPCVPSASDTSEPQQPRPVSLAPTLHHGYEQR